MEAEKLVVEMQEEIEKLFEEGDKIDKRKKKLYQEWKDNINALIIKHNDKVGFKCYSKIK
jgi:hypothetical protein